MAAQPAPRAPMAPPSPALSALKEQLYSEGSALTAALPLELGDAIVGSTLRGDGVLAAAMRLKFFGELDLLDRLREAGGEGGGGAAPHSSAAASVSAAAARRPDATPDGASREASGVSQLMREADILLDNLPADMARQVIVSILEDASPVAAKLRERLVLLLLAARPAPAAPSPRAKAEPAPAPAPAPAAAAVPELAVPSAPGAGDASASGPAAADQRTALPQDRAEAPTPGAAEKDEILEFNISRRASRSSTPYTQRFAELMDESRSFLEELPDTPARSILGAALDGESLLAAAVREQLYHDPARPLSASIRPESSRMHTAGSSRQDCGGSRPDSEGSGRGGSRGTAASRDSVGRRPLTPSGALKILEGGILGHTEGVRWFGDVGKKQDGEISPISSALHTPRSARGGALTPISELAARGIDLIRRLPDESAIGLIEALLNNESLVAAGVRTRLRKPAKQPPRKSGEIYSVKHNCCTQNGLLPTLGVITEGSLDVEGVLLDQFGQWPESANEYSRVRLDEEQAYQLTLRMEFAGKTFVVEPYTWQRLDKCEEIVSFRQRIYSDGKDDFVVKKCAQGEVNPDSVTGGWVFFEFDVDVSWNAFELCAEGHSGLVMLINGQQPSDELYDFDAERDIQELKKEWQAKEIEAEKSRKANDEETLMRLTKESAALYKQMRAKIEARPKAFCHIFPRVEELVHIQVVSKKVSFDQRPEAPVEMPGSLEGSVFPGTWHVGFKCTSDPRHPMNYKLGIRYTTGTHLQRDRLRSRAGTSEESEAEKERKRKEAEAKAIKGATDLRVLERIKWENWNKVGLAKALMVKYKDDFYPPKNHEKSVIMQATVRGFLARQRLKWLQQVELRRIQLKEKEEKMREDLPYDDKLLIRKNREKCVPQELDDLRFAEGAAMMLKYGDLQNPYKLAQAARAVFNVMDADGSGCMDTQEVREALKMLGLDNVKDDDLQTLIKHFDADDSGTIDREEFRKMVQTLCCAGKDIMSALKMVTNTHPSRIVVKKKPPVVHEVTAMDPSKMTRSQLENTLNGLKMRLTNRNASDKAKREKEEAERAAQEAARIAGEKERQEREQHHAEEMRLRQEKEAAEQASANEVLENAIFKTSIAIYGLLGEEAVDAGGEKLAKRIQRVFQVVNAGCDGELTFFEFQQAVASTDIFVQEEMLTLTFHKFDLDLNQALNVDEFTDMCTALLEMREKRKKKR